MWLLVTHLHNYRGLVGSTQPLKYVFFFGSPVKRIRMLKSTNQFWILIQICVRYTFEIFKITVKLVLNILAKFWNTQVSGVAKRINFALNLFNIFSLSLLICFAHSEYENSNGNCYLSNFRWKSEMDEVKLLEIDVISKL